jgi:hypothetical protein
VQREKGILPDRRITRHPESRIKEMIVAPIAGPARLAAKINSRP